MQRKLPIIEILQTDYYVDSYKEVLRQVGNTDNEIPFSAFCWGDNSYHLLYNTRTKSCVVDEKEVHQDVALLRLVSLPALIELDLEGISLRYDIPVPELLGKDKPYLRTGDFLGRRTRDKRRRVVESKPIFDKSSKVIAKVTTLPLLEITTAVVRRLKHSTTAYLKLLLELEGYGKV